MIDRSETARSLSLSREANHLRTQYLGRHLRGGPDASDAASRNPREDPAFRGCGRSIQLRTKKEISPRALRFAPSYRVVGIDCIPFAELPDMEFINILNVTFIAFLYMLYKNYVELVFGFLYSDRQYPCAEYS